MNAPTDSTAPVLGQVHCDTVESTVTVPVLDLCYSTDNESFRHDSLGDLIDELDSDGEALIGRTYWEADKRNLIARDVISVDTLLDDMDMRLYEEVGEISDGDCSHVPLYAKVELRDLLEQWIDKHVNLGRYWKIIGKTREKQLTAEDLADEPKEDAS